ncbi:MAG: S41 family peptidase [bacterium]
MQSYVKIIAFNIILSLFVCNEAVAFWGEKNSPSPPQDEETVLPAEGLQRLATIVTNIKRYYYRKIDVSILLDSAIKGMLAGLDPHSEYLGPEALKELAMETSGKFGGIGIIMTPDKGVIKVIAPVDDTPAYRAGIKAGDYIVQIDSKLVRDMTPSEYFSMIRGPKGSKLSLTILRKNESKPRVITLRREIIKIRSVKDVLLEPGYGYVRLAIFQESTEKDMVKAVKKLQRSSKGNLQGLILDMRSNPGGLLDSAVEVADDFLDATKLKNNKLIVYTKGQDEESQITATATAGELLPNVPLVILINEGSASAAEIVAGALQDHKRAIIVGTRSFGKGSVQTVLPINRASAIKLTTALYYTPLGRSIQAKGIEPDIDVEAIQVSHNQGAQSLPRIDESALIDHIQSEDGDDDSVDEKQSLAAQQKQSQSELDLMYKDYQLYEALHTLKTLNVMKNKSSQG